PCAFGATAQNVGGDATVSRSDPDGVGLDRGGGACGGTGPDSFAERRGRGGTARPAAGSTGRLLRDDIYWAAVRAAFAAGAGHAEPGGSVWACGHARWSGGGGWGAGYCGAGGGGTGAGAGAGASGCQRRPRSVVGLRHAASLAAGARAARRRRA